MKTHLQLLRSMAWVLALVPLLGYSKDMTIERAVEIIENTNSSPAQLDEAIGYLDVVYDTTEYWLELAADQKQTPLLRRMCVKHVFNHYTAGGITLEKLCKTLQAPADWISFDQIHQLTGTWTGKRPNAIASGGFIIPVLSELGGEYRLVLMIRFEREDNVTKEGLVAALKGQPSPADRKARVADRRAFDTIDQKKVGGGWIWESLEENKFWEGFQGNKNKKRGNP